MKAHRIAVIPGDGIGKEVVPEGLRALEAAARQFGIAFEWREFAWDCDQEKPGTLVDPLGFWYVNYLHKKTALRLIEIGQEVYGGLAPTKELRFERLVRYTHTFMHGGATGLMNLIKASKVL